MIDEHRKTLNPAEPRDIIDEYLKESYPFAMSELSEIFAAGSQTAAYSLQWLFAHLAVHQDIQQKLRQEIHKELGTHSLPDDLNLSKLKYLDAVMKESWRLTTVVPVWLPRKVTSDTTLAGYYIPKGTIAWANFWDICHDSQFFEKPNEFYPEHFLGETANKGDSSEVKAFTAFGLSIRSCPGQLLAETEVRSVTAATLQRYEIIPCSQGIDFTPHFGLITHPKKNVKVVIRKLH